MLGVRDYLGEPKGEEIRLPKWVIEAQNNKTPKRAKGDIMNICIFIDTRVAVAKKYTPEHITADGKKFSAKCDFSVYENEKRGDKEESRNFRFTAWGGAADAIARACPKGKQIHLISTAKPYSARVWFPTGQPGQNTPLQLPDGTFVYVDKVGFLVDGFKFGNDSIKWINTEIQMYAESGGQKGRPAGWDNPGSQEEQIWHAIRDRRNAEQFIPGSANFGFAEVQAIPQGAQYVQQNTGTGVTASSQKMLNTAVSIKAAASNCLQST